MENDGQVEAGLAVVEFDDAPLAIESDIEGLLFVTKLPQIARERERRKVSRLGAGIARRPESSLIKAFAKSGP